MKNRFATRRMSKDTIFLYSLRNKCADCIKNKRNALYIST